MQNQETISIIVPIYNVEPYLRRCIDSLLSQDYTNLEIILVDDESPDLCPRICDEYAEKYSFIKVFHKANGGLSDARNSGVKIAEGNLIVFVDPDDYVEKSYVSDLYNLLVSFDADMAITRVIRETGDGKSRKGTRKFEDELLTPSQAFIEVYSGKRVGWEAYGKIYKKELLLSNPFPDGIYEDMACLYKIIRDAKRIAVGNYEENYHYITREESILTRQFRPEHLRVFDVCDELTDYIGKKFPEHMYLSYFLYVRGILQMFKLCNMNPDTQQEIYNKYKHIFREGIFKILKSKDIAVSAKYYAFVLCLGMPFYRFSDRLIKAIKKLR